jgi:hypothetical protein
MKFIIVFRQAQEKLGRRKQQTHALLLECSRRYLGYLAEPRQKQVTGPKQPGLAYRC